MRFGGAFLCLKIFSLVTRSLILFIVFALSESSFGANHLMTFLSWVTLSGIALGFGASDSLTVCSEGQAKRVSRFVRTATLVGIGITPLLLFGSYWINVTIACINYGLLFWNLGFVRRRAPTLFEQIANFQMLAMWGIYLALISLESQDLPVLSFLYAFMNCVVAFIGFRTEGNKLLSEPKTQDKSLYQVSVSKLVWEINYSCLTRMPFLLPAVSGSVHSAFSYGYLIFEMASAMFSHYQTVFLNSRVVSKRAWILLTALLLAVNSASLMLLLIALHFQHFIIDMLTDLLGLQLKQIASPLDSNDLIGLVLFMLAITAFQCAAFGRYAVKLEANTRIVFIASAVTIITFSITWAFSIGYYLSLCLPFGFMLFAGLLLMLIISRATSNQHRFISR